MVCRTKLWFKFSLIMWIMAVILMNICRFFYIRSHLFSSQSEGSFALGDDDDDKFNTKWISFCRHEWNALLQMRVLALDDDDKLKCDDVVMNWVLYPFHDDDIIMILLIVLISCRIVIVKCE